MAWASHLMIVSEKKIWCGEPIIPCHYVNNRINILWDKTVFAKTDNAVYAVKSLVTTDRKSVV